MIATTELLTVGRWDHLRGDFWNGGAVGVDRERGIIYGVILAEAGAFKTRNAEFDIQSLQRIVRLANASRLGLPSKFKHANLAAGEDALDRHLGRVRNARLSKTIVERNGKALEVDCVRGDLYLAPTSLMPPPGGGTSYGEFTMTLAESDDAALACSLVLVAEKTPRLNLPALWMPTELRGVDVVGTGDATSSLLNGARPPRVTLQLLGRVGDLELLKAARWRHKVRTQHLVATDPVEIARQRWAWKRKSK